MYKIATRLVHNIVVKISSVHVSDASTDISVKYNTFNAFPFSRAKRCCVANLIEITIYYNYFTLSVCKEIGFLTCLSRLIET